MLEKAVFTSRTRRMSQILKLRRTNRKTLKYNATPPVYAFVHFLMVKGFISCENGFFFYTFQDAENRVGNFSAEKCERFILKEASELTIKGFISFENVLYIIGWLKKKLPN